MSSPERETRAAVRLPSVLAIGFTGHRTLPDEAKCRRCIRDFLAKRKVATPGVAVYGVSSAAAGGDLLFAETCLELGIPLRILLPLRMEHFRSDFDPATWQRVEHVLKNAMSVEVTGNYNSRDEAYFECGIQTVQQSQMLVALWDGEKARGVGGTADVVLFAEKMGKPVFWFHTQTGAAQVLHEKAMDRLLHDPELDFLSNLPDEGMNPGNAPAELVRAWFNKLDANASRVAPDVRRRASIPIVCNAAAALCGAVALQGKAIAAWVAASAALGITAAAFPALLRLDQRQTFWARTRTAAEVCRSTLAMWGTPHLDNVIGDEIIPELSGMLMSLNFLKMKDGARHQPSLEEFKRKYREERLLGQIEYFSTHSESSGRQGRRFRLITWLCASVAVLFAGAWLAGKIGVGGASMSSGVRWFALGISTLFQVATVASALAIVHDCNRRQQRFRELADWLKQWDAELDALITWPSVLSVAGRIEKALLVELLEWRSLIRHARPPRK